MTARGLAAPGRALDRLLGQLAAARGWTEETAQGPGAGALCRLVARPAPGAAEGGARSIGCTRETLDQALRAGLVARADGLIGLTATGLARVRRARSEDDGFRAQHRLAGSRTVPAGAGAGVERVAVNDAESPLAWLRRRKGTDGAPFLDEAQFAAGERLRDDHARAAIGPMLARPAWGALATGTGQGRSPAGGLAEIGDAVLDARARVERARMAVGPELFPVLVDVCCDLKGIETVERLRNWPPRSGKLVLQLALTRLARHYGYAPRV